MSKNKQYGIRKKGTELYYDCDYGNDVEFNKATLYAGIPNIEGIVEELNYYEKVVVDYEIVELEVSYEETDVIEIPKKYADEYIERKIDEIEGGIKTHYKDIEYHKEKIEDADNRIIENMKLIEKLKGDVSV